ncbi:IS1/IS1595 family N-terminal zinc-binding domain-containing protein [Chryseobacterium sp. RLHN22]
MISWGKQNGKRRFKCKNCGIYFTSENICKLKKQRNLVQKMDCRKTDL